MGTYAIGPLNRLEAPNFCSTATAHGLHHTQLQTARDNTPLFEIALNYSPVNPTQSRPLQFVFFRILGRYRVKIVISAFSWV